MCPLLGRVLSKIFSHLKILILGHQVILTTTLTGDTSQSGRITRRRPVKYTIRCGYKRFMTQSSSVAVESLANNVAGSITEFSREPLDLFLQLIDQNGFPFTKHVLEVGIDEKVSYIYSIQFKVYEMMDLLNCYCLARNI